MRAYQFSLRKLLDWRRTQLETEERKLAQLAAGLEELALAAVRLNLLRDRAEESVRGAPAVRAADLWALAAYRRQLMAESQAVAARKNVAERETAGQRQKVLDAQLHCRLLEKLDERRRAEWGREADRELERLASESFLAAWNRRAD